MPTTRALPAGTKFEILQLLVRHELSASALADRLGMTPAGVRQHLGTLAALGLVDRRRVVSGPSRPTEYYRLSAEGRRAFPKRYDLLLGLVIDTLVDRHGLAVMTETVEEAARRLAASVREGFARLPDAERWERLLEWCEAEFAWAADWTADNGRARIVLHHCPFHDVSLVRPVVCGAFFGALVRELYGPVGVAHEPASAGSAACCSLLVDVPPSS